ncbi:MAG TPA: aminoacyl-histidine dipeptidase [Candidatus Aminicenantes bacterium]|nr:aminoacyl-histidine dipeptidase [Candidatus Aminicenantes bacterium]
MNINHAKTQEILDVFEKIAAIPRCSKHEEKIGRWLMDWAAENEFPARMDDVGNIVIEVPASPGYEDVLSVVLQGHQDIVCEKTKTSTHDFSKDPIRFVYDGDWLTADETTLGADNGIAIAMAMVMATDKDTPHPPLELLFTVDEETGLTGANALQPGFIKGKILINIDSEDEGIFTVGCAGGINTSLSLPMVPVDLGQKHVTLRLEAGNMKGGHSGIDIALGKANAIIVMGRLLREVAKSVKFLLVDIKGGSAHNAIPRDCEAIIAVPEEAREQVTGIVRDFEAVVKKEYRSNEPNLFLSAEKIDPPGAGAYSSATTSRAIQMILAMPHGVAAMSPDIEGLVETSNNFANIRIEENIMRVLSSQRSSVMSRLEAHTARIESVALLAGGHALSGEGYPPWPPDMDSALLKRSIKVYQKLFNKEPVVEVIHAGLECGIIGDKYPGMDMISIGPTLKYPHSPDEKVSVSDIGKIWDFVAALFADLKSEA